MNINNIKLLLIKEYKQILKDKSILVIAFFLPFILIFIYGYGMNMDIKPIKVGLSCDLVDNNCNELFNSLNGSSYIKGFQFYSLIDNDEALKKHDIDATIHIPSDFSKSIYNANASILININGVSSQEAQTILAYIQGALSSLFKNENDLKITTKHRFNAQNNSTWFILSGQVIGVITLIASFMSALTISREWDRKTIDGLAATKAKASEIVISKLIAYYILSLMGTIICYILIEALFKLPFRGNYFLFILTILMYVFVSVTLGLLISASVKNQFLASEYAVIISTLPALLLSGALFDLRSVPDFIYYIAKCLPPTYAVESMRISYLSGDMSSTLIANLLILLMYSLLFLFLTIYLVKKACK